MSLLDFLQNNWTELLVLTREHILLVFLSTGFAIFIGLPLGILLTRVGSLRTPVLGFANIMQTVPSLALFGLLIPIPFIGGIGARTAIIALALYALLPVIRNTLTGILGIDTRVTEAATAMGMTGWQRLRMVELPLAMPVILTGIRVAVVISDSKSIAVVNIIGPIDIELLAELSGKLSIPQIDIEREKKEDLPNE